jgi:leader peptidase (prepilin peptidase) / N-methyltransferase
LARGQCRRCAGKIDPLHPAVEVACAGIGAAAMLVDRGSGGVVLAILGWQLLALAFLDARHFWLPHRLSAILGVSGVALGGAAMAALGLEVSLTDRIIGLIAGFAGLAIIAAAYRHLRGRDGLGGGDAPMFGAIGAWTGWQALPPILLFAAIAGLAIAALRMDGNRRRDANAMLPLGTLMALATPFALALIARIG